MNGEPLVLGWAELLRFLRPFQNRHPFPRHARRLAQRLQTVVGFVQEQPHEHEVECRVAVG